MGDDGNEGLELGEFHLQGLRVQTSDYVKIHSSDGSYFSEGMFHAQYSVWELS